MELLFAWAVGIAFAVWFCRWLWRARRDAKTRKAIAAGMAGEIAGDSIEAAVGDASSDWSADGGDGDDGGE